MIYTIFTLNLNDADFHIREFGNFGSKKEKQLSVINNLMFCIHNQSCDNHIKKEEAITKLQKIYKEMKDRNI